MADDQWLIIDKEEFLTINHWPLIINFFDKKINLCYKKDNSKLLNYKGKLI